MQAYCFMDFDGTLVSNKNRLYQFYSEHIGEEYKNYLTKEEFWKLKKMGIHEVDWVNSKFHLNIDKSQWTKKKIELIENPHYLSYDEVFPFVYDALEQIQKKYQIVLISRRENSEGLKNQIREYRLEQYFHAVEIINHSFGSKADFIKSQYDINLKKDIWIGDTEDDMEAGIRLGISTYLVLSGIRDCWITYTNPEFRDVTVIEDIRGICERI